MAISAQSACGANAVLSQCQMHDAGHIGWLEHSPDAGGAQIFCFAFNGRVCRTLDSGISIRSKVNEYGARAWCFYQQGIVYVDEASQQLYRWNVFSHQPPELFGGVVGARYSEPCVLPNGNLIVIEEWQGKHRIVMLTPEGGRQVLREGEDFYAGLTLSQEGELAWVSWQHPQQPWTKTRLWRAVVSGRALQHVRCLNDTHSSIQMPSFVGADLHYLDDQAGYWQRYQWMGNEAVLQDGYPADMANAPWQSGVTLYGCDAQQQWWSCHFNASGVTVFCQGAACQPTGATQIKELVVSRDSVLAIHAGPACMGEISLWQQGDWQTIWRVPLPDDVPRPSHPELLQFGVNDQALSGYWYGPKEQHALPPLIINLHGGPTAACYPVFNPLFQFWNDHGFAVLDLNYRGSSNQGRDYRLQLEGRWGVSDVEDVVKAVEQLIHDQRVAPDSIFIRGRSSGGYSVLMALLNSHVFCAAGVYFGVSDPASLHAHTHKFESHYLPWLLGSLDGSDPDYCQRVPLARAAEIHTPVIFFQGMADKVVTPEQTASMAAAIQAAGGRVETVFFANEGHGFRRPENNISALRAELAFYQEAMAAQRREG